MIFPSHKLPKYVFQNNYFDKSVLTIDNDKNEIYWFICLLSPKKALVT